MLVIGEKKNKTTDAQNHHKDLQLISMLLTVSRAAVFSLSESESGKKSLALFFLHLIMSGREESKRLMRAVIAPQQFGAIHVTSDATAHKNIMKFLSTYL